MQQRLLLDEARPLLPVRRQRHEQGALYEIVRRGQSRDLVKHSQLVPAQAFEHMAGLDPSSDVLALVVRGHVDQDTCEMARGR